MRQIQEPYPSRDGIRNLLASFRNGNDRPQEYRKEANRESGMWNARPHLERSEMTGTSVTLVSYGEDRISPRWADLATTPPLSNGRVRLFLHTAGFQGFHVFIADMSASDTLSILAPEAGKRGITLSAFVEPLANQRKSFLIETLDIGWFGFIYQGRSGIVLISFRDEVFAEVIPADMRSRGVLGLDDYLLKAGIPAEQVRFVKKMRAYMCRTGVMKEIPANLSGMAKWLAGRKK